MSLVDRRRPAFDGDLLIRVALVWVVVGAVVTALKWQTIALLAPANLAAQLVLPLAGLGLALLLAARIVWRLIDERAIIYAGLVLGATIPLLTQVVPQAGIRQGWQALVVLAALNGLMSRSERRGAWVCGGSLGLGLALGSDLLPVAGLFAAIFALRWLRAPRQRVWLANYLPALTLAAGSGALAAHGPTGLSAACDLGGSGAYLAGLAVAAAGMGALATLGNVTRAALALGMVCVALGSLATGTLLAPNCTPELTGLPAWRLPPAIAAAQIWLPLLGLYATLRLAGRCHGWLRTFWLDHAAILAGLTLIALLASQLAAIACAAALPPLAWQLREWHRAAKRQRRPIRRGFALAAIGIAAVPLVPLSAAQLVFPGVGQSR